MIDELKLRLSPEDASNEEKIKTALLKTLSDSNSGINDYRIVKRSIDARKKNVVVDLTVKVASADDKKVEPLLRPVEFMQLKDNAPRVIIVGAGPAGLFAALKAIVSGIKPILIERGRDVDSRRLDIAQISRSGKINPASNYCFGEGGAGAYSDGKLFTRSKKRGNNEEVLQLLVQHGASPDILIDSHPHIGSDKLPHIIKNIRNTIIKYGGEVHFETVMQNLILEKSEVKGVRTDKGDFYASNVIVAIGHSARDTIKNMASSGVMMIPKGFAVGVRLEHPQPVIDRIQYHRKDGRGKYLPPAEYNFVTQVDGRGVYSFCMCPGGVVVPAGSSERELVVNGMSASARAGNFANSGMVVQIMPGDFPEYAKYGDLELLKFQEDLEEKFYKESGNSINAPAQRMVDFTKGKVSETLPVSSYAPGLHSADFSKLFPSAISNRLKSGFKSFGEKAKGFLTNEAILIGLESRTSSPVRLPRDKDSMEHVGIRGLYPVGEGAGYAGGIVSAAVDGIRAMDAISNKIKQ